MRGARRQLTRKPPLPLARIIILEDMRRAVIPASAKSLTQLQPNAWIRLNITHVPCFDAVFRHDPELIADAPIAHWSTARFARLAPSGFQKRIAWRHNADSKQNLDRRIEEILLQQMNNPMFHLLVLTSAFLQTVRLSSRVSANF